MLWEIKIWNIKKERDDFPHTPWSLSHWCPSGVCNNYLGCRFIADCGTAAKSLQSCLTLCDSIDGSPPGSPVPGTENLLSWFLCPMKPEILLLLLRHPGPTSSLRHRHSPAWRLCGIRKAGCFWKLECCFWKGEGWSFLLFSISDLLIVKVKVKSLSRVWLFMTPWTLGSSIHGIF